MSQLYTKLCEKFEKLKNIQEECLNVCTDLEVSANLEKNFEDCEQIFMEFQDRFSQWTATFVKRPGDDRSSIVNSSSTYSSLRSKIKSAKAKRLVAEQKLRTVKEKAELERAKKELEIKQILLESESELEQARLEESIWLEDDGEINGTLRSNIAASDRNESASRPGNTDQVFSRLANTLHEGFNLPKPELLRFNGSILEYCKFVNNFETNIENRVSDDRLKLSYLIQFCDGKAKRAIENCTLLEPSEGYKSARNILFSRYGRPYNIARSYIDLLLHGPSLKTSDTEGISKLALQTRKCEITLSQLEFNSDIDNITGWLF